MSKACALLLSQLAVLTRAWTYVFNHVNGGATTYIGNAQLNALDFYEASMCLRNSQTGAKNCVPLTDASGSSLDSGVNADLNSPLKRVIAALSGNDLSSVPQWYCPGWDGLAGDCSEPENGKIFNSQIGVDVGQPCANSLCWNCRSDSNTADGRIVRIGKSNWHVWGFGITLDFGDDGSATLSNPDYGACQPTWDTFDIAISAASTQFGTLQRSEGLTAVKMRTTRNWCQGTDWQELGSVPNTVYTCGTTNVWSAWFSPASTAEATRVALHSDASIRFPDEPDLYVSSTSTQVYSGLHVNCVHAAAGSLVLGLGNTAGHDSWQLNSDQSISPSGHSDLVIAWASWTQAPCWGDNADGQSALVLAAKATVEDESVLKFVPSPPGAPPPPQSTSAANGGDGGEESDGGAGAAIGLSVGLLLPTICCIWYCYRRRRAEGKVYLADPDRGSENLSPGAPPVRGPGAPPVSMGLKPLNYFLSHVQDEAAIVAQRIHDTVRDIGGGSCWLDVYANDKTPLGMENGVKNCDVFIVILSKSYCSREFCLMELGWAQQYRKRVQPVILATEKNTIGALRAAAPPEFKWLFGYNINTVDASDMEQLKTVMPLTLKRAAEAKVAPGLEPNMTVEKLVESVLPTRKAY